MEYRTSANISDDRKVVLSALREVPEEITLMLSDAEQDAKIPNRYWFDFPNQWANQPNKDPIIGIRSIYTTKTNRFIKYNYKITLFYLGIINNDDEDSPLDEMGDFPEEFDEDDDLETTRHVDIIEGTMTHWLEGSDTIRYLTEKFNDETSGWLANGTQTTNTTHHTWQQKEIQAYYGYDRKEHKTYLYFGRGILESRYYKVNHNETEYKYAYEIEITPLSDDAKALFGFDSTKFSFDRVNIPVWSRYNCLVKSSIATNDKNNILGHTRNDPYTPLKYYRLTGGLKRFWIELYETRYHESPVSFPVKIYEQDNNEKKKIDRDDLIIEAIVCFSGQGML